VCLVFVMVLVATMIAVVPQPEEAQAQQGGPVVNVPAVALFLECPTLLEAVAVNFYYVQLDGTVNVLTATADNGAVVLISDIPTVLFEQVSFDWQSTDSVYEFVYADGSALGVVFYPSDWIRDNQSGLLYQGLSC
jgi:hypothetical protein